MCVCVSLSSLADCDLLRLSKNSPTSLNKNTLRLTKAAAYQSKNTNKRDLMTKIRQKLNHNFVFLRNRQIETRTMLNGVARYTDCCYGTVKLEMALFRSNWHC